MRTSLVLLLLISIPVLLISYKVHQLIKPKPLPKLESTWWGSGDPSKQDTSIRPFKIKIPDADLQDLKYRLDHAREFTPPLEGTQQQYGMNTNLLKTIVDYWRTQYNWRKREDYLNKFPQFKTNIQGLDIHYIHVKPKVAENVKVLPLLILHGWPGSVREFYELIPLLLAGRDGVAFEVYVPSLPGFGFSEAAVRPGLGASQMSVVFKNFMERMGHEKYYIQGGDFGAIILKNLGTLFPEKVLGYHSNFCVVTSPLSYLKSLIGQVYPSFYVREDHYDRVYPLGERFGDKLAETGYFHLQATKPDTIGVALKDSPVGLAAYMLEKYVTGTDRDGRQQEDGHLTKWYTYDSLLDQVMIYWVTGSMPTAVRLYAETFNKAHYNLGVTNNPITVPTACARFKNDFYSPDGAIKDVYTNLLQLEDYDQGHFAAFQVPKVLASDIFTAVAKFQKYHENENNKQ